MEETELGSIHGPEATRSKHGVTTQKLARGDMVGRYVVVDIVGHGGMGVVYSAYDPELDRRIALKLLLPRGDGSKRDRGRARLLREAQALAKLNHPNVVTVHDVGEHDGRVFVAMEYIEGATLKRWITRGPHPWKHVLDVLTPAGRGLVEAHSKGMTHRDFKPDNVMIADRTGRVVVMDFGLATAPSLRERSGDEPEFERALSSSADEASLTRTGSVVGTPAYMAPEQHGGAPGPASDQFSFCVTAHEALYGRRPFSGNSSPELLAAALHGKFVDPPPGDRVPRWLREVVLRGLAAKPSDRWPTMDALLEALHADPSRRRWLAAGAVATAAVMGGIYGGMVVQQRSQRAECQGRAEAIDAVWGEEERARLASAFEASPLTYASDTWRRAEASLDQSVRRWSEVRLDTCIAESDVDAALRLARDACLDKRLGEIATVVRILSEPDADVIQRASRLAEVDVESCSDDVQLRDQPPALDDAAARDARQRMEQMLSDGVSLRTVGKLEAATDLQQSVLEEARALDDEHVLAQAQFQLGHTRKLETQYYEAARLFEDAYFLAMSLSSRGLARKAALSAVDVHGDQLGDAPTARRWARHAQLLIDDPSSREQAELDLSMGRIEVTAGNLEQGLELGLRALHVFEAMDGPHSERAVSTRMVLMIAHDRLRNVEEALANARAVLESRLQAHGPDHPNTLNARINLAAALFTATAYEEAEQHLRLAIERFQPPNLDTAAALDNLSLIMTMTDRVEEAAALNDQVLELRERLLSKDNLRVAHTLLNGSQINLRLGRLEEALSAVRRAREIYRRNGGDTSPHLVGSERGEAAVLLALGCPKEAAELLDATWQRERAAPTVPTNLLFITLDLVVALLDAGDPQRALEITTAMREIPDRSEANSPTHRLNLEELHGTALLATGSTDASIEVLERAIAEATALDCCEDARVDAELILDIARWTATSDAEARTRVEGSLAAMVAREDPDEAVTLRRLRSLRPTP